MNDKPTEAALNLLFDHKFYWCEADSMVMEQKSTEETEVAPQVIEEEKTEMQINEAAEPPIQQTPAIQFLGENRAGILMVFSGGNMSEWPKERKLTFLKILQSKNLEFDHTACIGINEIGNQKIDSLQQQVEFKHLFLWGVDPQVLGLHGARFEIIQHEGFNSLSLPDIQDVQDHVEQKRKLWDTIKDLDLTA